MARSLTIVERQERHDFILNRLKRGFSSMEVQRQFSQQYGYHTDTARRWVNSTCKMLSDQEGMDARLRSYAVIVEMLHDQIISYQGEILAIAKEIEKAKTMAERWETIQQQLSIERNGNRIKQLLQQLEKTPEVSPSAIAAMVESKSRVRQRLNQALAELIRLRGFSQSPDSIRVVVDAELTTTLQGLKSRMSPEAYGELLNHIIAMQPGAPK